MFSDRTNWNLETNRLSEALAKHRASGKRLFDLAASNPTECGFEYDGAAILKALSNPAALGYAPDPKGMLCARQAVAAYYSARNEQVSVEDIVMTTSTSEAYSFVFRMLCNTGDELLIPSPGYPLFDYLAELSDVKLVRYPLLYDHGWQIDFHSLERAITPRTRGVIVVHPNNPTGHFAEPADIARLNEICAAHEMALIADEVFLDFGLGGKQATSFATNGGALTFTMSGLSKICGLPQMKVAWLVTSGPAPWKAQALARLEVIADTYLSMSAPVQAATPAFLNQRHSFQKQLIARVQENLAELDAQLAGQKSCSRLEVEGGWYAVLRVPAMRGDEELALELLAKKDVYAHPGHFYDFPSDGYLVVSLITSKAVFSEGMGRLLSIICAG
jgi:alanine-synthesizing transaminase